MQRVLVIDDDELSREVLSVLLEGDGYVVDIAGGGEEALRLLADSQAAPDLVLMDMQMPGVAGEDLGRRLREASHPSMLLIAMSGSRMLEHAPNPFDGFLLKPFSMQDLSVCLEQMNGGVAKKVSEAGPDLPAPSEVLNPQTFMTFKGMLGAEPLRELYQLCLDDTGRHLLAMRAAAVEEDDLAFRRNAHAIKGSLGMLGASELQQMCGLMEEAGLTGNHSATLADLPDAIERLRSMLIALDVKL